MTKSPLFCVLMPLVVTLTFLLVLITGFEVAVHLAVWLMSILIGVI